MKQKLIFSIENAELIEEDTNSNFAKLSLDFFASGNNLHEMFVSEDTLFRTASTIKNCPLLWKYDPVLDDIYTHDKDEVPCGFVPETSDITSRILPDGRTMLSTIAYVWKKYTGELLKFFKRDGGEKPVSVEMSVLNSAPTSGGFTELLDFRYEAITILGSFVTPAIPYAKASVLSFADIQNEYVKDFEKEFHKLPNEPLMFAIPQAVKDNTKKGLELRRKYNKAGTSISMAMANYIDENPFATLPDVEYIAKNIPIYTSNTEEEIVPPTKAYINWLLWGGESAQSWADEIIEARRVEKETNQKEMSMKTSAELEKMAEEEKKQEAKMAEKEETPAEEKAETPEEEKKEEEKGEEKKFEFPENFDMELMGKFFGEEETYGAAKVELCKGAFADPKIVMGAMFAKMCKMAEVVAKMAEDQKAYMAENEELRKFKADEEEKQKAFEVEKTFKEMAEKVVIPEDDKKEMAAEAEKYSFARIEEWKTYCKAKSFDFAIREGSPKSDVVRIGLASNNSQPRPQNDIWAGSK